MFDKLMKAIGLSVVYWLAEERGFRRGAIGVGNALKKKAEETPDMTIKEFIAHVENGDWKRK